jgi:hypothetical protein
MRLPPFQGYPGMRSVAAQEIVDARLGARPASTFLTITAQ